jgi:hypothetical protein
MGTGNRIPEKPDPASSCAVTASTNSAHLLYKRKVVKLMPHVSRLFIRIKSLGSLKARCRNPGTRTHQINAPLNAPGRKDPTFKDTEKAKPEKKVTPCSGCVRAIGFVGKS